MVRKVGPWGEFNLTIRCPLNVPESRYAEADMPELIGPGGLTYIGIAQPSPALCCVVCACTCCCGAASDPLGEYVVALSHKGAIMPRDLEWKEFMVYLYVDGSVLVPLTRS